jgi:amino acid adenylation domain-containing protein
VTDRLQDLVTRQAEQHPARTAVVLRDESLSYGELEHRASRLARVLARAGVRAGDRVCLLVPKAFEAIWAMLGVLRANALYVPLDPASPAPRLARMVAACDDRWILAAPGVERTLAALMAEPVVAERAAVGWLGLSPPEEVPCAFTAADVAHAEASPPPRAPVPDDAAHLLFTSGSTGQPKGVVVTHPAVLAFLAWAVGYFGIGPDDRVSQHPPLQFDLSTFDIYAALGVGAELHLVPPELNLLPHKVAGLIREHALTQWFSVPAMLNLLAKADAAGGGDFPSLRRVLWCGEVLPTPTLQYWMRRVPHARFTNLYGPTETTIASSYYTVPACPEDPRAPIPIGRACAGEELLVLDHDLRPVPPGDTGELYVAGVGLSPGYWRDPDKTAAAFVSWPRDGGVVRLYRTGDLARVGEDGAVYFLGRADTQIKTRGYRVELGEVEAALASLAELRESAAIAVDTGGFEGVVIGCAYAPAADHAPTPAQLRTALARLLPPYMLPALWLELPALPRNPNGKVDRPALRARLREAHGA